MFYKEQISVEYKTCHYCEGAGYIVIKNAYHPEYSEAQACEVCGGLGVIACSPVDKRYTN